MVQILWWTRKSRNGRKTNYLMDHAQKPGRERQISRLYTEEKWRKRERKRDWTGNSLFKVICHFISCCCCSQDPKDVRPLTHTAASQPLLLHWMCHPIFFFFTPICPREKGEEEEDEKTSPNTLKKKKVSSFYFNFIIFSFARSIFSQRRRRQPSILPGGRQIFAITLHL